MITTEASNNVKQDEMNIFVFRTNIDSRPAFILLQRELEKLHGLHECSIDLEDCDNVLRIVCEDIPIERIMELVESQGFFCEELTY